MGGTWTESTNKVLLSICLTVQKFGLLQHFVLSPNPHESQKLKSYILLDARKGLSTGLLSKYIWEKKKKRKKKKGKKKGERESNSLSVGSPTWSPLMSRPHDSLAPVTVLAKKKRSFKAFAFLDCVNASFASQTTTEPQVRCKLSPGGQQRSLWFLNG